MGGKHRGTRQGPAKAAPVAPVGEAMDDATTDDDMDDDDDQEEEEDEDTLKFQPFVTNYLTQFPTEKLCKVRVPTYLLSPVPT